MPEPEVVETPPDDPGVPLDLDSAPGSTPEAGDGQPPESPSAGETEPETPTDSETPQEDEAYSRFLAKYNGDHAKAGAAYWENVRSAAALHEENEQLRARLEARERLREPEPEEVHPDLAALDQEITVLQADLTQNIPKLAQAIVDEHQQAQRSIGGIEDRIEQTKEAIAQTREALQLEQDPDQRRSLRHQLDTQIARLESANARLEAANARAASIQGRFSTLEARRLQAQKELRLQENERARAAQNLERLKADQEQEEADKQVFRTEHRRRVNDYTTAAAKKHGLGYSEELQDIVDAHLVRLVTPLNKRGVPATRLDWSAETEAVVARLAKLAKGNGARVLAQPRTPAQQPQRQPATPVRKAATPPPKPGAPRTREELERAAQAKAQGGFERLKAIMSRRAVA